MIDYWILIITVYTMIPPCKKNPESSWSDPEPSCTEPLFSDPKPSGLEPECSWINPKPFLLFSETLFLIYKMYSLSIRNTYVHTKLPWVVMLAIKKAINTKTTNTFVDNIAIADHRFLLWIWFWNFNFLWLIWDNSYP